MVWLAERERELIRRIGPVVLRRFDELVADWTARFREVVEIPLTPPDLPLITRVAIEHGVDAATERQRAMASTLAAQGVSLDRVVTAVLLWEETLLRRLARDAVEDIFGAAAALNRLLHGLVLAVAEEYQLSLVRHEENVRLGFEQADRLKMEVISMISHDLQTPITTIKGAADSMLGAEEVDPDQRHRFLQLITQNAARLSRLISQILDLSRIEARAMDIATDRVDVPPVLRRIVDGVLPSATVKVDLPSGLPAVRADRDQVERIVVNLLDNALRHSPPGIPVTVAARDGGEFVEIRVEDQGPGVPEERRTGLFSKFYQVDSSLSGRRGGSGLGLAIVKGLAETMGGSVGYRPNRPSGSVFWVRLPVDGSRTPRTDGVATVEAWSSLGGEDEE